MIFEQLLVVLATHHESTTHFSAQPQPLSVGMTVKSSRNMVRLPSNGTGYSIACAQLKTVDESLMVGWAALPKALPHTGI
jgi:hypothetical protein